MSNLKEIRTDFVKQTGRFDLVVDTTDYADNGADAFIQEGQDMLDRMLPERRQIQRYPITAAANQYYLFAQRMRTATDVRYVNDDGKKVYLTYLEYEQFTDQFPKLNLESTSSPPISSTDSQDSGTPTYWTIPPTGVIEPWNNLNFANQNINNDLDGVTIGDAHYNGTAILIGKPPDRSMKMTVFGRSYSKKLTQNTDTSFWSVINPQLLIKAAMYSLESIYRNTEGMRDFIADIQLQIDLMDRDEAEFENVGITKLEG